MRKHVKFALLSAAMLATAPAMLTPALAQTTESPAAPVAVVGLPEGFVYVESSAVTGDEMKGIHLYDLAGDKIAKVEDIVIGPDDKVAGVLVDVGGFLGLGAHKVELKPDQLQVYKNADKKEFRAYTPLTKDELKALPEYKGAQ
ncbi:PRC-barrel domain-containing protein [Paracoccus aminovorans]|uniref:PRC-barrel domain-containing protein n=1 Tax=Paracoccus aminovorans TaxID=34004 RepID=UPI002B25D9DD|nr:PRC-barrel domain-containing protein [Paracoccus aminovorans]